MTTQAECDTAAAFIQTANSATTGYAELLAALRAVTSNGAATFSSNGLSQTTVDSSSEPSMPTGCRLNAGSMSFYGKLYWNSHPTGAPQGFMSPVCVVGTGGASGDPHFTGGDGDTFDF